MIRELYQNLYYQHVSYLRHMASKKVCNIDGHYYLYERDSYWDPVQKKSRQRNSRYIGPCDKEGNLLSTSKVRIDAIHSSFPIGPLSIFYAAAKDLDLKSRIKSVLDSTDEIVDNVLCLALNQIAGRRPIRKLSDWVLRSPLVEWESLSPESITEEGFGEALGTLCHIGPDGITEDRGLVLQHEMTKAWRGETREPAQFYYDITKQIYYGTACPYAEPGYFPGGTHKYVIGFGLVTSRKNHHPVLCRAIPGSYNDKVTVQDTVNSLKSWGYERLTLILDRGMVSKDNVEFLVGSGFDQVGIVPETNKAAWEYVEKWPAEAIEQPRFVVDRRSGDAAYARSWLAPILGQKQMRVAVVVNPTRKVNEQVTRDLLLHRLNTVTDKEGLRDIRSELGNLTLPATGRRGFTVDQELVKEDRKGDGRFLMFSTDTEMDTQEMFDAYFQKDVVEKAFRTLKGEISLGPIRYRRRDRIDAYTTVVYLAYLLWSWAERKLREKHPHMTLDQALETVENVALVKFKSGKTDREWVTKLTTDQEKVLKAIGATKYLHVS